MSEHARTASATLPGLVTSAAAWQVIGLSILSALSLYALFDSSVVVDGIRYFWLDDDQMISMRYAYNLAAGDGLVWNPGERVEGYSNFLWTLVMATVHLLGMSDPLTVAAIRAVNWLLAGAVLVLSRRLLLSLAPESGLAAAAVILSLALAMDVVYWSVNGFETTLLTAAFLWLLTRVIEESARGDVRLSTYLLAGLLPLIRSDAHHASAAVAVLAIGLARSKARAAALAVLVLALPAAHLAWRYWYYGDWLPNTYYLKVAGVGDLFTRGLGYVRSFASHYAVALVFAVVGSWWARDVRRRLLLAGVALAAGHVLLVGSDIFLHFRFMAHVVPVVVVLAAAAVVDAAPRLGRAHLLLCVALFVSILLNAGIYAPHRVASLRSGNGMPEQGVVTGLLIRRHSDPAARIAVVAAGNAGYFSRRYAIDLLGKSDRHVARRPVDSSGHVGHNRHDVDHSLGLSPDLIVTLHAADSILRPDFCSPADVDGLSCTLTRHPVFVGEFRPNPIPTAYLMRGMAVYARAGSPEWARRTEWQEPLVAKTRVQQNARAE